LGEARRDIVILIGFDLKDFKIGLIIKCKKALHPFARLKTGE
jgi:hypothetical protein